LIWYPTFWVDAYSSFNLLGIILVIGFILGLAGFFYKVKQELKIIIGIFDRKLMNSFRLQMNSWIDEEKELIADDLSTE
jgi:hypothetical protein